ncbi:MAG: NAD-dependent epimerase/dehydratase family protein [Propionibacteriales bacterium]|nr:NAD-dependent epimerase/dehydratase family protein [Propionibacteriales bacterium]
MRVLVTGAAGFIGSAVCQELGARGHRVVGLDAMIPQAHPRGTAAPEGVRRVDLRDTEELGALLRDIDVVCHQAAMVGAGSSPADMPMYAAHNDLATARLLAAMASVGVDRLVLASSMVVYGEGRYRCPEHGDVDPVARTTADLRAGRFDLPCPDCGTPLDWALVDEGARLRPRTSYAASKLAQEQFANAWAGQAPGRVVALRYHNVYGPMMPRDTPYSGVAAIFRSALEGGEPPRVFEDGRQMRDFVHVSDVARANVLAVERVASRPADGGGFEGLNVCSGAPISIAEVAGLLCAGLSGPAPVVTGEFRSGDVRHVVASPARTADVLGFVAEVPPDRGLREFSTAPLRPAS